MNDQTMTLKTMRSKTPNDHKMTNTLHALRGQIYPLYVTLQLTGDVKVIYMYSEITKYSEAQRP